MRKLWLWSDERKIAKARARYARGLYRCEACGVLTPDVEVDHAVPLGPVPGSRHATAETTWDTFIARLFCPPEELRVLCVACHKKRTARAEPAPSKDP